MSSSEKISSTMKTKALSKSKKDIDYSLYKYSDIQSQWIICEGHLNYRSVQIKFLNISQCKRKKEEAFINKKNFSYKFDFFSCIVLCCISKNSN